MSSYAEIVDWYIATWNETDAGRRRDLIARTWTKDARYIDPLAQSQGHHDIDAMIRSVQERFPGLRFRLDGKVDGYADRVRFSWTLAPEQGGALVKGTDFAIVTDGKLAAVTGFIDQMPQAGAQ
ncbi:MAG: nuclear transport factor 2 family protein [Acetobacteraceae bacterium]|nr:nuclear transport factor 2 family protein [Acetobacteraceae bacterium]